MSHHSSENHDINAIVREYKLKELCPRKFAAARTSIQASLDNWYLPGVIVNSKVRQKLLGSYAEFLELGEDMDVHHDIAAKISRCHTILTSDSHHRSLPQAHDYCRQSLFCQFCINQRLQRIGEQFNKAIDSWRGSRNMQNVQIHDFVFHPEWYNRNKRCSDVPRAFAAIREFRKRAGAIRNDLNDDAKRSEQKIGPMLWGIHCSQPKHTFEGQVVPMPHLHLCFITSTRFTVSPLKEELRQFTEKMLKKPQPDPASKDHAAIRYKKGDSVSFDADPEVMPDELANAAAYIGRVVKVGVENAALMTALAGRAVQMYAGKTNCDIMGIKGQGFRRRPVAHQASPTFANKALVYQRVLTARDPYVQIYRNPACFPVADFDL